MCGRVHYGEVEGLVSMGLTISCYKVSSFVHNVWSLSRRRQCKQTRNGKTQQP